MCSRKLTRRLRSSDRSSRPPSPQYRQTHRAREGRKIGKHCFSRRSFLATSKSAIQTNATRSGRKEDRKALFFSSIVPRNLQVRNTDKNNPLGKKEDRKALFFSSTLWWGAKWRWSVGRFSQIWLQDKFESKFLKPTFYIFGYLFELCTQIRRFFLNFGPILATKNFNKPLILGLLISNIS